MGLRDDKLIMEQIRRESEFQRPSWSPDSGHEAFFFAPAGKLSHTEVRGCMWMLLGIWAMTTRWPFGFSPGHFSLLEMVNDPILEGKARTTNGSQKGETPVCCTPFSIRSWFLDTLGNCVWKNLSVFVLSKDFVGSATLMLHALFISEHVLDILLGTEDIKTHPAFCLCSSPRGDWKPGFPLRTQPGFKHRHCFALGKRTASH